MPAEAVQLLAAMVGHLPAAGARRRLQALLALGHPYPAISAAAGTDLSRVLERDQVTIPPARHEAVLRAWHALSGRPGTCPATRMTASLRRYAPPLAWDDDDDLDDPATVPLPEQDWRRDSEHNGHSVRSAVLVEDVEFLLATGERMAGAARRLELTAKTLERALHRAGRGDLLSRLNERHHPDPLAGLSTELRRHRKGGRAA